MRLDGARRSSTEQQVILFIFIASAALFGAWSVEHGIIGNLIPDIFFCFCFFLVLLSTVALRHCQTTR